jgi:hypothetical protein
MFRYAVPVKFDKFVYTARHEVSVEVDVEECVCDIPEHQTE